MRPVRKVLLVILALFLFPLGVHAALYASKERPASFRDADWSSVGMLPEAGADREARFLVFTGRTGRWKGIFAVHSWVVFKPENATTWSRYDVVGWGQPVRNNGWAPDGRWFGDVPRVLVDVRGAEAAALIPKSRSGDRGLQLQQFRRLSHLARPEQQHLHRDGAARGAGARGHAACRTRSARTSAPIPMLGLTDSGTGIEASLWGLLGVKVGWVEGIEVNFLGLVAGLDLRHPARQAAGLRPRRHR